MKPQAAMPIRTKTTIDMLAPALRYVVGILYAEPSARNVRQRTLDPPLCTSVTMTRVFGRLPSFVCWRTEQGCRTGLICWSRSVPVTLASSAATRPMRYENQKLEGLTFDLDDDEIIGCHLVDCRIL